MPFILLLILLIAGCGAGRQVSTSIAYPFREPVVMAIPPADAVVFSNLENAAGNPGIWEICTGTCAGTGTLGAGSVATGQTIPDNALADYAMPGLMLEERSVTDCSATGSCYGFNTLGYRHLGCMLLPCEQIANMQDDLELYIPSGDDLQALEFDPDIYTGTMELFISMQCDSVSGDWRFWNMSARKWVEEETKYPCDLLDEPAQWHRFQLYATVDPVAGTYTFQTLMIDGQIVYGNLGLTFTGKPYVSAPDLNIEQQIDNKAIPQTNVMFYDNYSLAVWP